MSNTREIGGMTSFSYRATRPDGVVERGVLQAAAPGDAAIALAARGLMPVEIMPGARQRSSGARVSASELAIGLRILADLLEAGLPITRALGALENVAPAAWREVIPFVRERVREGSGLSAALRESPVRMPPVVIGLIAAGERGSGLPAAVRRAADVAERAAELRSAMRSALLYPAILSVGGTIALALITQLVLPRFTAVLADSGLPLPASTRLVLGAAAVVRVAWLPAFVGFVACALAVRRWIRGENGRLVWHRSLLVAPLIGPVRLASASAYAADAIGALLESGVPVAAALQGGAEACGDAELRNRVLRSREDVIAGERLAGALQRHRALSPLIVRLAHAGEESGNLALMFGRAARMEQDRTSQLLRSGVRVIEPALVVLFGGLVALTAIALLQAMYSMRPA